MNAFVAGLGVVNERIERLGLIRLSVPETRSAYRTRAAGLFAIRYCRRVPLLAVGYAISPAAAQRLLARGAVVREPVDKFIQRFWVHEQPVHAIHPQIVEPGDVAGHSDIGERSRPRYGLRIWLRRALRKAENAIRRDLFVLRLLIMSRLQHRYRESIERKKDAAPGLIRAEN